MKNELLKMLLTRFSDETLYAENGLALRYRLFTGKGENLPLVLFLHGMGERGHDNQAQILNNGGAHLWAAEEIQQKYPCHIVAPQCPDTLSWAAPGMPELLAQLVDTLCAQLKADPMRLYVCGLSMGGMGAWNLAGRYPGKFAAVMPVCGGASIACAAKIGRVPLRAYHAADDPVVPPTGEMRPPFPYGDAPLYGSRLAVSEATRSGDPFAEYIEYPAGMIGEKWGHPHASWEEAFRDPQAISWMFRQSRLDLYEISCPTPGVWEISDSLNDSFYVITGRDRALVIDTGMARGDVPALVREITALPFDLALTHGHGDHSAAACVELTGGKAPDDFSVREFSVPHDHHGGARRGMNTIRQFCFGSLRVVHMGDTGCMPDGGTVAALRACDALLLPVGGYYTVDAEEAYAIAEKLAPSCIVPMHYRGKSFGFDEIGTLDAFTALFAAADVRFLETDTFALTAAEPRGVIVPRLS